MISGVYKTNGLSNLYFAQLNNFALEPGGIGLIDKLWVDVAHDLYYNRNGINLNLTAAATNYWTKAVNDILPAILGDNLDMGAGSIKTDLGFKDQYVLIPVPLGEPFTSFDNLGVELITDGDFPNNTNWTEESAWLIGAGKASVINGNANSLYQSNPPLSLVTQTWYVISFDIIDTAAGGTITPSLMGSVPVVGLPQSTDIAGTYVQNLLSTDDSLIGLSFTADALASGASVDNVSIKAVISFLSSSFTSNSIIGALNEIINGAAGSSFNDSLFEIYKNTDNTAITKFDLSAISSGNTSTISVPDKSFTLDKITSNFTETNIPNNKMLTSNGTYVSYDDLPTPITNYARFLDIFSVTGDGAGLVTVVCNIPHLLIDNDIVIMSTWDIGDYNGAFPITVTAPDIFTYSVLPATPAGVTTGGTGQYVIGQDTELIDVILAKYKCNDIVVENNSGTSVALNIGTTLGGTEIASGLVCASGTIEQIVVNSLYSSTTTQSIFVSASVAWGSSYIDVHINQTKVMK